MLDLGASCLPVGMDTDIPSADLQVGVGIVVRGRQRS